MDFKRMVRTPVFWVLAVLGILLAFWTFDGSGGYTTVTTSQAEQLIADKKVDKAVLTTANVLTLDLKEGQSFSDEKTNVSGATKVRTEFVDARAESLVALLKANVPSGYNDKIEGDSAFWTIFIGSFCGGLFPDGGRVVSLSQREYHPAALRFSRIVRARFLCCDHHGLYRHCRLRNG